MAIDTQVIINGTVYPATATEPTHSSNYGEGGWRSVSTEGDLASIPTSHIIDGMGVYVRDTGILYTVVGSTWSPTFLVGDVDMGAATIGDTLTFTVSGWVTSKVDTINIDDFAVTTIKIAPNAIDTSKLAVGAVDNLSLATYSVLSGNLGWDSVYTESVQDYSITESKMASASIPYYALQDGSVGGDKIIPEVIEEVHMNTQFLSTLGQFLSGVPSASDQPISGSFFMTDINYLYVSVADDTWERIEFDTTPW